MNADVSNLAEQLDLSVPYLRMLESGSSAVSIKKASIFSQVYGFNLIKFIFLLTINASEEKSHDHILKHKDDVGLNDEITSILLHEYESQNQNNPIDTIIAWLYVPIGIRESKKMHKYLKVTELFDEIKKLQF